MSNSQANYELVDLALIDDPEIAMRGAFDESSLHDLIESIRAHGLVQPVVLRRHGERFEVIAGHRRTAACGFLRMGKIPAVVRDASDSETAVLRMHENLIREEVDPVSEALFIVRTMQELKMDAATFANEISRSRDYVENRIEIATMPDYMQQYLRERRVSLGVALALNRVEDENIKRRWTEQAIRDGMTVRAAEQAANTWNATEEARRNAGVGEEAPPQLIEMPVLKYQCARCGGEGTVEQMRLVRIHNNENICSATVGAEREGDA